MFVFTVDESESCTSADPGFDPELQEKHNELPFAITPTAQGSSQSFLELLHAPVSPATSTQRYLLCKKGNCKKDKSKPRSGNSSSTKRNFAQVNGTNNNSFSHIEAVAKKKGSRSWKTSQRKY